MPNSKVVTETSSRISGSKSERPLFDDQQAEFAKIEVKPVDLPIPNMEPTRKEVLVYMGGVLPKAAQHKERVVANSWLRYGTLNVLHDAGGWVLKQGTPVEVKPGQALPPKPKEPQMRVNQDRKPEGGRRRIHFRAAKPNASSKHIARSFAGQLQTRMNTAWSSYAWFKGDAEQLKDRQLSECSDEDSCRTAKSGTFSNIEK